MIDTTYSEFVNEEMSAISNKKLRDAMHDIIVELGPKETIDVEEMSDQLMAEYKITISPFFLDKFLEDFLRVKKGDKKARTFFTRGDLRWLGVRDIKGTKEMRNNLLYQKPSLTRHKRKLFVEDEKRKLDDAYASGMKDLNFSEDKIKLSLMLQRPEDSKEIMKNIYSDVVIDKKYENSYDNCWKLMMLIGRRNNLDRIRGYFQYAPQSIKDEFYKTGKWSYDLKPPKKEKEKEKKEEPNKEPEKQDKSIGAIADDDMSPTTKENLALLDEAMKKYSSWEEFVADTKMKKLISIIDSLKIETPKTGMDEFLSKLDQLNFILMKFFRVDRKQIITFYKGAGLAGFLREWEAMQKRPIINDF